MPNPKNQGTVLIDQDLKQRLKVASGLTNQPMSTLAAAAISAYLEIVESTASSMKVFQR